MMRIKIVFIVLILFLLFVQAEVKATGYDKYGGWEGIKGTKTGFFHTQKIGNRWWIITPEGNIFFATIMSGVRMSGIPETGTNRRPYKEACLNKYQNESVWAETALKRLEEWRFNTVGNWSSKSVFSTPGVVYLINIGIGKKAPNVIPERYYGYFPDVFDPLFEESFRERLLEKFDWYSKMPDDPWLLGYFLADEPAWYGSKNRRGGLVDDFISLPESSYGKKAWRNFIAKKYQKIENLNETWEENFKSFDELLRIKKTKENKETITKDKLNFLKSIAEEFSRKIVGVLREYDQNHMILGSRPSRDYPEVIEVVGTYTDIYAMSCHHLNQGYEISPEFDRFIDKVYSMEKKPLLLGVLISAKDSGLPFGKVKTQKDRGISYWRYLKKLASHPNIVGLSWFQYFDPPRKCYDNRAANWGVVNYKDEPHEDCVKLLAQANKNVYSYALGLANSVPQFGENIEKEEKKLPDKKVVVKKKINIPNAYFEGDRVIWQLQAWKGSSKAIIDKSIKHTGNKSAKIIGGTESGWGSVGVVVQYNPPIELIKGVNYRFSGWLKLKDVEDSAFLRIKTINKDGSSTYYPTDQLYGTKDWTKVEIEFTPAQENTVQYLNCQLIGQGVVWVDNLSLEVVE